MGSPIDGRADQYAHMPWPQLFIFLPVATVPGTNRWPSSSQHLEPGPPKKLSDYRAELAPLDGSSRRLWRKTEDRFTTCTGVRRSAFVGHLQHLYRNGMLIRSGADIIPAAPSAPTLPAVPVVQGNGPSAEQVSP